MSTPDFDDVERAVRIAKDAVPLLAPVFRRAGRAVARHREARRQDCSKDVVELSNLTPEEVADRVEANPAIGDLLAAVLEEAERTSSQAKRRRLARVAVEGLLVESARAFRIRQLLRTVSELEDEHVHLLSRLAAQVRVAGPSRDQDFDGWLGDTTDLAPAVAALQRAGVISTDGMGPGGDAYGGAALWALSRYGERFLLWLREGDDAVLSDGWTPPS